MIIFYFECCDFCTGGPKDIHLKEFEKSFG